MNAIADFQGIPDSMRMREAAAAKGRIRYTGFLAQNVEAAAQAIKYDFSGVDAPKNENDHYGLRYAEFVVPLVKAVQELDEENEVLKEVVENQEARLAELESIVKSLVSATRSRDSMSNM